MSRSRLSGAAFFACCLLLLKIMKNGKKLDADALKEFLKSKLAKYKIPEYIFRYDEFPLLLNGKVDAVNLKKDMNERAAALRK